MTSRSLLIRPLLVALAIVAVLVVVGPVNGRSLSGCDGVGRLAALGQSTSCHAMASGMDHEMQHLMRMMMRLIQATTRD